MIEKKVNETEFGYVLYEEKDIITELLSHGYAKLRGEKLNSEHFEDYKDAEEDAKMHEIGIWSEEAQPEGSHRYLKKTWTEQEFYNKFSKTKLKGIVEEIHPSKAIIYFSDEGFIGTINFSEVQVVVLSEKSESNHSNNI